ncbi:MAG: hypothetical protein AAFX93_01850 [Verrucomicrobiota bacterium]
MTAPSVGLLAQNRGSADEKADRYIFHVLYFAKNDIGSGVLDSGVDLKFATNGDEVYQVAAYPNQLSRAMSYSNGSSVLTFFKEVPDGEGGMVRQPMARVDLGKPGTKLIIMTPNSQRRLSARAVDIGGYDFGKNKVRIINFSKQTVRAMVGETIADIVPMSLKDYSFSGDTRRFFVPFAMAGFNNEESYVIEKKRYAVKRDGRHLIIVFQDSRNPERVTYRSFAIPDDAVQVTNISDDDVVKIKMEDRDDFKDAVYEAPPR